MGREEGRGATVTSPLKLKIKLGAARAAACAKTDEDRARGRGHGPSTTEREDAVASMEEEGGSDSENTELVESEDTKSLDSESESAEIVRRFSPAVPIHPSAFANRPFDSFVCFRRISGDPQRG